MHTCRSCCAETDNDSEVCERCASYDAERDCYHEWQPGAEGAFAGLSEHCSNCGLER